MAKMSALKEVPRWHQNLPQVVYVRENICCLLGLKKTYSQSFSMLAQWKISALCLELIVI